MTPIAADFPDAVIRLFPVRLEKIDQHTLDAPRIFVGSKTGDPCELQRIDDFAVDIELRLPGRGIANANRPRTFVTGEPG